MTASGLSTPPRAGLGTRYAPSFRLIGAHFLLGVAGLLGFAGALAARAAALHGHYFQPLMLGLVHLCVLGWLLPIALGALHQLVPVVFETPLCSERLAWVGLALYLPGAIGVAGHMWAWAIGWGLVASAGLLASGIALYVANLVATLARAATMTLTGVHVIAALGFLLLAAGLGFALAWNLHQPFLETDHLLLLRAHAHAAALGFFGLLIMGVAYRLLEMFLLSHGAPTTAGWIAFGATALALASLVGNFVLGDWAPARIAGALGAGIGVGAFFVQVRAIFVRRMRRRTDVAWRHSAASFFYLAAAVGVGIALASGVLAPRVAARFEILYALLALPGFVGSIVVGQMYKIVPFLVWFHRFSRYVGLKEVPAASELLPERPQALQWALMHAGLIFLFAGVAADLAPLRIAGAAAFAASAAVFARNFAVVFGRKP